MGGAAGGRGCRGQGTRRERTGTTGACHRRIPTRRSTPFDGNIWDKSLTPSAGPSSVIASKVLSPVCLRGRVSEGAGGVDSRVKRENDGGGCRPTRSRARGPRRARASGLPRAGPPRSRPTSAARPRRRLSGLRHSRAGGNPGRGAWIPVPSTRMTRGGAPPYPFASERSSASAGQRSAQGWAASMAADIRSTPTSSPRGPPSFPRRRESRAGGVDSRVKHENDGGGAALPVCEREVLGERGPAVRPGLGRFDGGRHPQHAYVVASRAYDLHRQRHAVRVQAERDRCRR